MSVERRSSVSEGGNASKDDTRAEEKAMREVESRVLLLALSTSGMSVGAKCQITYVGSHKSQRRQLYSLRPTSAGLCITISEPP